MQGSVRRGAESDFDAICRVFQGRVGGDPDATLKIGLTPEANTDCLVAEVSGQIVGFGNRRKNKIKIICRLKGSTFAGVADDILAGLEQLILADGLRQVSLYAQPIEKGYPAENLIGFYLRHGYRVTSYNNGFSIDQKPFLLGAEMVKDL